VHANLEPSHPPWQCCLFQSNAISEQELRKKVFCTQFDCHDPGMQATDLPPHLAAIRELKAEMSQMSERLTEVQNRLTAVPSQVKEMILTSFTVNGAIPVQRADIHGLETRLMSAVRTAITAPAEQKNANAMQEEPGRVADSDETDHTRPNGHLRHRWLGRKEPNQISYEYLP
jgi:hypothetical protein